MLGDIPTLDDFDLSGKKILLRVDLNTPLDPETDEFLDDRRFQSHRETLRELLDQKCSIVCAAHQGRPGEADFTTLEKHAKRLSEVADIPIEYVDDIFGSQAQKKIKNLGEGECIMLENLRFYSEEVLKRPMDVQAKTYLVLKLAPLFDLYVNDAFAVSHRSQPSVVGFPQVMNAAAGRLMEKEVRIIGDIHENPRKPVTFILGGTKADDGLRVAQKALDSGTDTILVGGVVANILLAAKGYRIGEPSIEFIRGKKMTEQIDVARGMIQRYGDRIVVPKDVALAKDGRRVEIPVGELPQNYRIVDIGHETMKTYKQIISESGTLFFNGALGLFENKLFSYGTMETIKAVAESESFSVIGGGHTTAAARETGVVEKISHVSSGGGACVNMLAGYPLPAIDALKSSAQIHG
ncbi:MAG: phosphoglycerate kinase [Candidatus Altiarchaeales archaeon]|nr:phosphoglycerate kinase [Candidatus Altiarchaeales archaeon]